MALIPTNNLERKMASQSSNENEQDLISQMPPPIIHSILNLIPNNKERTRTTILSKTWNHLFLTRPNLVFHESDFNPKYPHVYPIESRNIFVDYVNTSLDHCIEKSNSHSFESMEVKACMASYTGEPLSSNDVNTWFEKASIIGIRKISLLLGLENSFKNLLLNSHKLVQLDLGSISSTMEFHSINLPNLKNLSFENVDLNQMALNKLVLGCPSVEIIHLSSCHIPENLQLSNLSRLIELSISHCIGFNKVQVTSPFFQNFFHFQYSVTTTDNNNSSIEFLGFERVTKLQLSKWVSNSIGNKFITSDEFKFLVELKLVCIVIKGVICSQSVRNLLIRFCNGDENLGLTMAEIDCPNLDSLEYRDNTIPFRFLSECNPKDLKCGFYLSSNEVDMQIESLKRLFSTTFIANENLKVVIFFPSKDTIIVRAGGLLIDVMISILNQIEDPSWEPKIILTTGSIDWNEITPIIYQKAGRVAINVVSLCDDTFPKVVSAMFLSLGEKKIMNYVMTVRAVAEDNRKENIPTELQQYQIAPFRVSRIIVNFDCSKKGIEG